MSIGRKILEFINVIEDDDNHIKLSQTKLALWGSTGAAFLTYWSSMDHQTQALATGMAMASWVKAEFKRRAK